MITGQQIPIAASDLCFGCGKNNPCGLKLEFEWDGKAARAEFTPTKFHQGWREIIHGGLLTTVMDEAMAYATSFENIPCVTATMQVRLRRPAVIDQPLIVTASVTKNARKFAETEAKLTLRDGTIVAEAKATQFVGSSFGDKRGKFNNAR